MPSGANFLAKELLTVQEARSSSTMLPVDQHELLSLWSTHCDTIKGTQDYQDNPEGRQEQVHILTHTGASNDLTGLCKESSDEFCQQEHS